MTNFKRIVLICAAVWLAVAMLTVVLFGGEAAGYVTYHPMYCESVPVLSEDRRAAIEAEPADFLRQLHERLAYQHEVTRMINQGECQPVRHRGWPFFDE